MSQCTLITTIISKRKKYTHRKRQMEKSEGQEGETGPLQ
jgi:hypothetical protein